MDLIGTFVEAKIFVPAAKTKALVPAAVVGLRVGYFCWGNFGVDEEQAAWNPELLAVRVAQAVHWICFQASPACYHIDWKTWFFQTQAMVCYSYGFVQVHHYYLVSQRSFH